MPNVAAARRSDPHPSEAGPSPWRTLTSISFILSIGLVACRLLMRETLRTNEDPLAGGLTAAPASPGPATGLVLDLMLCLPALLVLGRRAFDEGYRLVFFSSHVPMALLAILAALSPLWAADRFAATVSGAHLICALVFLWSTSQLIRTWLGVRLIGGACIGLLMALLAVGYYFRTIELTDLRQSWDMQKNAVLASHGWKVDSYEATMFENRVLKGEPMGFSTSTNTYAALLVLLGIVSAGVVIQHGLDGDDWGWAAAPAIAIAAAPPLIYWTGCRAAFITPFLGAILLGVIWRLGPWMARRAAKIYVACLSVIALGVAAVVMLGVHRGSLAHDSLTFRWRYWVGAWRVLTAGLPKHPFGFLFGVGWENFGPHYLMHRLPIASEEIRDPHNFVVRVFVELGVVGGVLLLIWLATMAWEAVRRAPQADLSAPSPAPRGRPIALVAVLVIATTAIVINIAASIDFLADPWYTFLELARRAVFFCTMVIGLCVAALRVNPSVYLRQRQVDAFEIELDDRPAPWVKYAILVGLATFLLHNLIEFSLFEPGPLFLFALLGGAAIGIRGAEPLMSAEPSAPVSRGRQLATAATALGAAIWMAAALLLATPVAVAESFAHEADNAAFAAVNLRDHDPAKGQQLLQGAASSMGDAWRRLPWNGDYAARAARLSIAAGVAERDPAAVRALLDAAIAADPSSTQNYAMRAQFLLNVTGNRDAGLSDYRQACDLDPNNVRLRLGYALALHELARTLKQPTYARKAIEQYDLALFRNDQLARDEVKRLTPRELSDVKTARSEMESLLGRPYP